MQIHQHVLVNCGMFVDGMSIKQVKDESYQKDDTSSPIISEMAVKIMLLDWLVG
jgi:hypothetical protein